MVQTTEPGRRHDPTACDSPVRCLTARRRFLRQPKMRSVALVVADVLIHQPLQMALIKNDHMVEQVAAAVSNPPLRNAILPRTSIAGLLRVDAEALHGVDHFFIEVCTAIKDQLAGCCVIRKRLAQLLNDPSAGRMFGHIEVEDSPTVMRNYEEAIKNAESNRRRGEEIHRGDSFTMIAQKGRPSLSRFWIPRRLLHPAQDSWL